MGHAGTVVPDLWANPHRKAGNPDYLFSSGSSTLRSRSSTAAPDCRSGARPGRAGRCGGPSRCGSCSSGSRKYGFRSSGDLRQPDRHRGSRSEVPEVLCSSWRGLLEVTGQGVRHAKPAAMKAACDGDTLRLSMSRNLRIGQPFHVGQDVDVADVSGSRLMASLDESRPARPPGRAAAGGPPASMAPWGPSSPVVFHRSLVSCF